MLDPSETTVIVNPAAGSGRVGRAWGKLEPQLRGVLGEVDFRVSERAGGAEELARRAVVEGRRTVLSFGGDGTHNEVVNGIMAAGRCCRPEQLPAMMPGESGAGASALPSSSSATRALELARKLWQESTAARSNVVSELMR